MIIGVIAQTLVSSHTNKKKQKRNKDGYNKNSRAIRQE